MQANHAPQSAGSDTTVHADVPDLRLFVFALFFIFGGITSLNDILIPKLKELFTLSYTEAMLIQSAFFFAYFVVSLPGAAIVRRLGYMKTAVVGLLASSAVAATGIIAFVGLLVPHIMRIVLGPRHRHLLWTSALLGATVTLLADLAARTLLSPAELPLGVVTALIGAPFFLLLLRSTRRSQGGWA